MTDPDLPESPAPAAAEATVPPPAGAVAPRRSGNGALWLLVLALLAAVAWLGWREWLRLGEGQHDTRLDDAVSALAEQVGDLAQGQQQALEPLRRGQRTLEQRLADAAATNALLREEVLAVTERAALLEDAIARQAEQRLRGEMLLKLNEAEFLLLMGAERLRLFADPAGTLEAYRLADATLATVDDAMAGSLRDTLAQELDALADLPRDPVRAAREALDAIAAALPGLPPRSAARPVQADADGASGKLLGLLSGLVTVRRVSGEDGALLDPLMREATAAALALDLAAARAAAERADTRAYHAALMRAEQRVLALYEPGAPAVADLRQQIAAAAALDLAPAMPALGATLAQLRNLRSTRSAEDIPVRALDGRVPSAGEANANAAPSDEVVPLPAPVVPDPASSDGGRP